jgi:hypothetical protein
MTGSRALSVLANGYLFSAMIVIPLALTFPGAFTPEGLLGTGPQTSAWLNTLWRFGFLAALGGYACLKGEKRTNDVIGPSALAAFCRSLVIAIGFVCALTWGVIAGDKFLPRLLLDDLRASPLAPYTLGFNLLISVLVLLLVWIRRTSVLDLWIIVTVCMLIS